jgi:quercetin dioxygenase-like cupin family protein
VFMDSVSSPRGPASIQYSVTAIGRSGRSRPATSPELRWDGRGTTAVNTETNAPLPAGVVVTSVTAGSAPPSGQVARNTLQENEKSVTQIVRLGPAAQIPVHHHPHYNETVIIHSGDVELTIGGQRHFLRAGQVAYIPAGTTMSVLNTSRVNEAQVVAVFSNVGTVGPLMVAGPGSN